MKALRFLRALPLALLLIAPPAMAEQSTIVLPTSGPKTAAELMTAANAALLAIQSCNSGTTAPTNGPSSVAKAFQCWADTSAAPSIAIKQYDGTTWVTIGVLNTSAHTWTPYRQGLPIAAVATSSSASDLSTGTLPAARLPPSTVFALGGVMSKTCPFGQFMHVLSALGEFACVPVDFTDITGTASAAQLPAPTSSTLGGVQSKAAVASNFLTAINTDGSVSQAQPVKGDVGLGNVDNTSDATKWAATATLTNKTFDTAAAGNSFSIAGLAASANTGTGSVVRATSPALVTPNLGTPSAVNLSNATSMPLSGVTGLGTGVATALATPSSANLRAAITDETGTGSAVFGTSPNITTPTGIVKGDVGLGNVDNTSDVNKPVSTAQAAADALKVNLTRNVLTGCGLAGGGDLSADRTLRLSLTINAQTGTSYGVQDSDCGKLVTLKNASPVAVTLPQANGSTFISGWSVDFQNKGAGLVTVTPATSTINDGASISLSQNQGMHCDSDGTNYSCVLGVGAGGGSGTVTNVGAGYGIAGGNITASGTHSVSLSDSAVSLASNLSMSATGTDYTGPVLSPLAAGTWHITGGVLVGSSGANTIGCRMQDSAGSPVVYDAGQSGAAAQFTSRIPFSVVVTNPTGNISVICRVSVASTATMYSATTVGGYSPVSALTAVRIR